MSSSSYQWKKLSAPQRAELLAWRRERGYPLHSPPRWIGDERAHFLVTAACYQHHHHIGKSLERIDTFANALIAVLSEHAREVIAWCVLPNHYHALVDVDDLRALVRQLGKLHGRTSYCWNYEERTRGRRVFFRCSDRAIRSERHFWATLNYVHHNPVHHGYVEQWTEWPWSSATTYLTETDPNEAKRIWNTFPVLDYGKGWDDAVL